jgi:hypothetical protein
MKECDILVSKFACKWVNLGAATLRWNEGNAVAVYNSLKVGQYKLSSVVPYSLKRLVSNPRAYVMKNVSSTISTACV